MIGKSANLDQEKENPETPERNLWFAVIERALKDYCFFFDKLRTPGNGQLIQYDKLSHNAKESFNIKAICEINRLRWFIYDKTPTPFNLEYLTEQLYDDGPGAAASIRKEASAQFKLHYQEAEVIGQYMAVIHYVRENTNALSYDAAKEVSKLRYKRNRWL